MGAASQREPEVVLEDGLRKRREGEKAGHNIVPSSRVTPLTQVWIPSQRVQNITIWVLLAVTIFFSLAVVVEELQASWYRSPALNVLNSQLYGAQRLDRVLHGIEEDGSDEGRTIDLVWNITRGVRSPDGVRSNVYLINREFLGPTIEARSADILHLELINSLQDEVMAMDFFQNSKNGVQSFWSGRQAQVTVPAQDRRKIEVRIPYDKTGTFMYRARNQKQASGGLFGALIIQGQTTHIKQDINSNITQPVGEERVIVVNDWHPCTGDRTIPGALPTVPPSVLINGIGNRNCSQIDPSLKIDCTQKIGRSQPNMHFTAGKTYRLRIINAASSSGVTVTIPGTTMTIIELDGGLKVQPKRATSIGVLKPSQSVDVLVQWAAGGDDEFVVTLDDDLGDAGTSQAFPIRVSGFLNSQVKPPAQRYRDILRLKPLD